MTTNNEKDARSTKASLRLINVTDTYKFDNFPSLKTLIEEKSLEAGSTTTTKTIMSGDFLAPYLLSSYDDGEGMMRMLNAIPINILTWGNHDINDLSDAAVMKREREYSVPGGVWINSNMTEHPTFAESSCQVKYHVEEIKSQDGTNIRRIGFLGVITDDPKLFKNCNPGMKKWNVQNPYDVLRELTPILKAEPHNCDLIVPICHLYEREDAVTCKEFDFPVILSGHDHHVVDEVIHGTRLLKAGSDCDKAIVLDISWADGSANSETVDIAAEHLTVSDFAPNKDIAQLAEDIQSILKPLMHTQLAEVPAQFSPLSTVNERGFFTTNGSLQEALEKGTQCTMGQFILSLMRDALNTNDDRRNDVDACVMKGGNIKCSQEWPPNTPFTLAMLFSLWSPEKNCHIFTIPGSVLKHAFVKSYDRPHNGWIHYDDGVLLDKSTGFVTHVGGELLEEGRLYRIASGNDLQRATDGAVIGEYLKAHPEHMPDPELAIPVSFVIIQHAVKTIWRKLWQNLDPTKSGTLSSETVAKYDTNQDGNLDKKEILGMIKEGLEWPIHESQDTLVDRIFENVGLEGTPASKTSSGVTSSEASLSLEHLNDLYQAHQGRPSGAWFFSRSSGVYGNNSIGGNNNARQQETLKEALKGMEHLDF